MATQFDSVDAYVAALPPQARSVADSIRQTIRIAAPDSVEAISYQMPCFKWKGQYLIHFGAWKKHIGLYPIPKGTPAFEQQVSPYVTGKGTVRLPLEDPIPHDLVRAMVTFRMKEISAHAE